VYLVSSTAVLSVDTYDVPVLTKFNNVSSLYQLTVPFTPLATNASGVPSTSTETLFTIGAGAELTVIVVVVPHPAL
jgi:hypothetical protein